MEEVDGPARPVRVPQGPQARRSFADRWPFRRKLTVLVGVPLVVVGLLLAYVITGLVGQARHAASAARLVRDSRQVAELVDCVQTEHQQALLLSVRYEAATSGRRPSLSDYRDARAAVDAQVQMVRLTFGSRLPAAEAQVLDGINGWGSLRSTVEQSYLPADNIDPAYLSAIDGLIDGLGLDRNLADTRTGSLLDSLLRAEAAHSSFETAVFSAQTGDTNALIEFVNAVGDERRYADQAARFGRFATDRQRGELAGIEQNPTWNTIDLQYAALQVDPSSLEATGARQVRAAFTRALRSYPQYRAEAQNRLSITNSLIDQIASRADAASNRAWWRAALLLGAALVAFIGWLALSVAVRRSVIRPVQALTGAAVQVAETAGQELARVADDDADDAGAPRLPEVPVLAHDEIGDLAEAFNRVQGTATALLERQVLSRRNVAEMFGNVGRRISNLTARQLSLIDAVERGETDPELLDRLYRIDHLASRLQRNADSLMLLAGIREPGLDAGPTLLTNVVRAALGRIEGYQRVSLRADSDVTVAPDIIADLTLMLAELVENAVSFSPAGSPVEVVVRNGPDGALIAISDHGLGMDPERLAEENARLIRRERLDLVPTKVLGLFVVGSLARRWGMRVTLSRTPGGGLTSQVALPSTLLLLMSHFADGPAYDTTGPGARNVDAREALLAAAEELPEWGPPGREPAWGLPEGATVPDLPELPHASASGDRPGGGPGGGPGNSAGAGPEAVPVPPLPRRRAARNTAGEGAAGEDAAGEDTTRAATPSPPPQARPGDPGGDAGSNPVREPADDADAPAGDGPGTTAGDGAGSGAPPLPRRVPRQGGERTADPAAAPESGPESGPAAEPAPTADPAASAPVTSRTAAPPSGARPDRGQARPLRRRVRGATLRATLGDGDRPTTRPEPRIADAEAVRNELEEFEAAVERAHRDSAATADEPGTTEHRAGLPEGAQQ
nr:ATP-binding protein [Streptomyces sp. HPF1205]